MKEEITITEADIKDRRKKAIRKEQFLYRLLILFGAVQYKVSFDRFDGYSKTIKLRAWHPLTWIMMVLVIIFSIPIVIWDAFKGIGDEFKEKTYYC
jgi:hypothetical protein